MGCSTKDKETKSIYMGYKFNLIQDANFTKPFDFHSLQKGLSIVFQVVLLENQKF